MLCLLALLGGGIGAILAWFFWVRVNSPQPAIYWILFAGLASAPVGTALFLRFRKRLYPRASSLRLGALALSLLCPLVLVECGANLSNPFGYQYYANSQRYFAGQLYEGVLPDHSHPPNYALDFSWGSVRTNAEGWRDSDLPLERSEKPDRSPRILGLGDSVLFSWGVDDAEALDHHLEERLPSDAAVINTGNGSYSSLDQLLVLRNRGLKYQPDLVFVLVIENDFRDRAPYIDQVDWLVKEGLRSPGAEAVFRREQVRRPEPIGPSGALERRAFLATSQVLNRSFLLISLLEAARSGGQGAAEPAASPSPPPPPSPGTESPRPSPGGSPASSQPPSATPSPGLGNSPKPGATDVPDAPARDSGQSTPAPGLLARYPFVQSQTEALREIEATCRAEGLPLVVFTFFHDLELESFVRTRLVETEVVPLRFPQDVDPKTLVNSRTDSHWNPAGMKHFAALMAPHLEEALAR